MSRLREPSAATKPTPKMLRKENPKERDVLPGETFSYHANFTHKLYRITVSQISPKELGGDGCGWTRPGKRSRSGLLLETPFQPTWKWTIACL